MIYRDCRRRPACWALPPRVRKGCPRADPDRQPSSFGGLARQGLPGAQIIDVTSKAAEPWVRLSPFYPHGGITVPQTPGVTGQSVEGIWQALKVFETTDVDLTKLDITTMVGLKRTVRRYGQVRGHRDGLRGERLLGYETARRRIYLPAYRWVLENKTTDLIERLRGLADEQEVLLLDYTTNGEVTDPGTPLSHAALVRLYLQNEWPDEDDQSVRLDRTACNSLVVP